MLKTLSKQMMVIGALGMTSTGAMAACYIDSNYSHINSQIQPYFNVVDKSVKGSMNNLDTQLKLTIGQQTDTITAALKVLAQQKSMTATQVSDAIAKNTKIEAAAEDAKEIAEKKIQILEEYGPAGQGHQTCMVQQERERTVHKENTTKAAVTSMIRTEVSARPGRYADRGSQMATRLALHDQLYCTASQAASGLCAAEAPRAGKSLLASTMFEPASKGSDEYNDKSAFINNMAGLAHDPLLPDQVNTIMGQSYADNKRRVDSIKSTAITYLKNLQAQWSGTGSESTEEDRGNNASEERQLQATAQGDRAGSGVEKTSEASNESINSLAAQLKKEVDRYFGGGEEYKSWSQTLVGLNERGVMKELLQVKALRLKLAADEFEQLSQQEAMLAAYTSAVLANSGLESTISKQREQLLRANVKASVISQ